MYALPTVVIHGNISEFKDGILVHLPVELKTKSQIDFYVYQCSPGWNICPQGYQVYVCADDYGYSYVFPGLIVKGRKNSSKRFYAVRTELTEKQVVDFALSIVNETRRIEEAKHNEISLLIHDLRGFSSAIYNSAEEVKSACYQNDKDTALERIESVIAAHFLLSIRIDLLDFAANQISLSSVDKIRVFRKVDKVVRCFRPKASAKKVSIQLTGRSFKSAIGPAIFELIIYSLIENAIKYSPSGESIVVAVNDLESEIVVSVKSIGPKISRSERVKIFERGYRAKQAEKTSQVGTGIGLNSAKLLLENHFGGTITVHQTGEPRVVGVVDYLQTEFEILVPSS